MLTRQRGWIESALRVADVVIWGGEPPQYLLWRSVKTLVRRSSADGRGGPKLIAVTSPASSQLIGRWRILAGDLCDRDYLNLWNR